MANLDKLIKAMKSAPRTDNMTVAETRAMVDSLGTQAPPAPDATFQTVDESGFKGTWCSAPGVRQDGAILYVHGGGFISGSTASHGGLAAEVARRCGVPALLVEYGLAPEHRLAEPVRELTSAYQYLLGRGLLPSRIAVVADSAGGAFALMTLKRLLELGASMPACVWLISPWVDLSLSSRSMRLRGATDPAVSRNTLQGAVSHLLGGDAAPPPLEVADFRGLPPHYVQVGNEEALVDDASLVTSLAAAAGIAVTIQYVPRVFHVWHLFWALLPEARAAIRDGGHFVKSCLAKPQRTVSNRRG